MKTTLYEVSTGLRLPKQLQLQRIRQVIHNELTQVQRDTLLDYHIYGKTITQIAQERGVQKSTVSRTLRRAEARVRRCLRY